jgi:hypothetical protein
MRVFMVSPKWAKRKPRNADTAGANRSRIDARCDARAQASASVIVRVVSTGAKIIAAVTAMARVITATRCHSAGRVRALMPGWREAQPSMACRAKDGAKWWQIAPLTALGEASEKA